MRNFTFHTIIKFAILIYILCLGCTNAVKKTETEKNNISCIFMHKIDSIVNLRLESNNLKKMDSSNLTLLVKYYWIIHSIPGCINTKAYAKYLEFFESNRYIILIKLNLKTDYWNGGYYNSKVSFIYGFSDSTIYDPKHPCGIKNDESLSK